MAGLLDLAPLVDHVEVRGGTPQATIIEVYGVSARGVAQLLFRFPALRKALATGRWDEAALLDMSDDVVAAIIAAGLGKPGDPATEEHCGPRYLSIGDQATLLGRIVRLTMPAGPAPLLTALEEMGVFSAGPAPRASSSNSAGRSSGSSGATPTSGTGPRDGSRRPAKSSPKKTGRKTPAS